ncbi:MAG: DNA polymerase-3 subunit delta' [Bradymonadia bacterium]|jgi:DNA polymerase-3 subunit delta'
MALTFSEVVGHERALGALRRAFASDRLHHAHLFSGPSGIGKRTTALALAALVNCESPVGAGEAIDSCGRCTSCIKMRAGQHPDLTIVEPDGRFIKIAQVRSITSQTRFRPYEGKRRVFIVCEAHTMRAEAANALLKTLEEPRGDTMFVLLTGQRHVLLTTVISRCQPLRFGPLSNDQMQRILARRPDAEPVDESILRLAAGSVGRALELSESSVFSDREELCLRLTELRSGPIAAATGWADQLSRARDDVPELLSWLRTMLRDAVILRAGAGEQRVANVDAMDTLRTLASGRSAVELVKLSEEVDRTEALLAGNVNVRMALESLLIALRGTPREVRT